jgi:hypothetical protein
MVKENSAGCVLSISFTTIDSAPVSHQLCSGIRAAWPKVVYAFCQGGVDYAAHRPHPRLHKQLRISEFWETQIFKYGGYTLDRKVMEIK